MSNPVTRRHFLESTAAAVIAGSTGVIPAVAAAAKDTPAAGAAARPVIISSANGIPAVTRAMELLKADKDPLDAVIAGVQIQEDDAEDTTVGYGGLPNEQGIVELDASVMHGPTGKAGAVAAMRNIRHAARTAQLVMQRTDHVLIVGQGATDFARAHGMKEEDLLTEKARKIWLSWKEQMSDNDDWLPPPDAGPIGNDGVMLTPKRIHRTWGTINCLAVTSGGDIAGVTTTSGLSFKIPGRVGDSPIIGAGLFVDNAVGAAGSTGRGEANLQNCSSAITVEMMRNGLSPEQASLEILKRIADRAEPRLRDKQGRPSFDLKIYAVAKDGRYGAASIWSGAQFALHDGNSARKIDAQYLYSR